MEKKIEHKHGENQGAFYLFIEGKEAGEIEYLHTRTGSMIIVHTGVREGYEGQGLGQILVEKAVEFARQEGFKVVPQCPFAAAIIRKNPELQDVLA